MQISTPQILRERLGGGPPGGAVRPRVVRPDAAAAREWGFWGVAGGWAAKGSQLCCSYQTTHTTHTTHTQDEALRDIEDEQGFTPLATAAEVSNEEIATLLLDRGADVNQVGSPQKRRITALMVATYHKQVRACCVGR